MIGQIRITRHWLKTNSIKEKNQVNQKNDWKQIIQSDNIIKSEETLNQS